MVWDYYLPSLPNVERVPTRYDPPSYTSSSGINNTQRTMAHLIEKYTATSKNFNNSNNNLSQGGGGSTSSGGGGGVAAALSWSYPTPKIASQNPRHHPVSSSVPGAIAAYGTLPLSSRTTVQEILSSRNIINDLYAALPVTSTTSKSASEKKYATISGMNGMNGMNGVNMLNGTGTSPRKSQRDYNNKQQQQRGSILPQNNGVKSTMYSQPAKLTKAPPAIGTEAYYLNKMNKMLELNRMSGFSRSSPSKVTNYMYIGGYRDADNWPYLRQLGITHVLNMAASYGGGYGSGYSGGYERVTSRRNPYPPESGIVGYEPIFAEDCESYDVMQHFSRARAFMDKAKYGGGKVLVHCAMGINRSGTMCCAYLMAEEKMSLLDAVQKMKSARGIVLTNRSFQKQLLRYARHKGHL